MRRWGGNSHRVVQRRRNRADVAAAAAATATTACRRLRGASTSRPSPHLLPAGATAARISSSTAFSIMSDADKKPEDAAAQAKMMLLQVRCVHAVVCIRQGFAWTRETWAQWQCHRVTGDRTMLSPPVAHLPCTPLTHALAAALYLLPAARRSGRWSCWTNRQGRWALLPLTVLNHEICSIATCITVCCSSTACVTGRLTVRVPQPTSS